MKIKILSVTTKKNKIIDDLFFHYQKRLPNHISLKHIKVPMVRRTKTKTLQRAILEEEKALLKHVSEYETLILLDEKGKQLTSKDFASLMGDWLNTGQNPVLAIGGPDGFSQTMKERARTVLSLSMMTFPHAIVPILLAEQLYRSWTILNGQPYHRD